MPRWRAWTGASVWLLVAACSQPPAQAVRVGRQPAVSPDYAQIVVPPNLAPLNFRIVESGEAFCVRLGGRTGDRVTLTCSGMVDIPIDKWRRLSEQNRGGEFSIVVWARRAGSTGRSYSFPRVSPDGRLLVFCAADHGYFTIHNATSDLWVMDLDTRQVRRPQINSDESESYHSWSANSRWMVFSSKRLDGRYARPFITHVDEQGQFSKPFVLPQRDPRFYGTYLLNYNVPELVRGAVSVRATAIRNLAYAGPAGTSFDPTMDIDALSGATYIRLQSAK